MAALITNIFNPVTQFLHLQLAGDLISKSYNRNKPFTIIAMTLPIIAVLVLLYLVAVPRFTRWLSARLATVPAVAATASVRIGTGDTTLFRWLAARAAALKQRYHR